MERGEMKDGLPSKHPESPKEGQLVYEASIHDLKNLLTASQACLQAALRDVGKMEMEGAKRFVEVSLKHHQVMTESVSSLLDYVRSGEGGVRMKVEAWPVVPLVEHVMRMLEGFSREQRVTLRTQVAEKLPMVKVDGPLYIRLLTNLIINAIRHLEDDRTIDLCVSSRDARTVLTEVVDRGSGIDPALKEHLFEKRLPWIEQGGHGLGLYLSRIFVERLGGEIWVESEPGRGTTVAFTVPIAP